MRRAQRHPNLPLPLCQTASRIGLYAEIAIRTDDAAYLTRSYSYR